MKTKKAMMEKLVINIFKKTGKVTAREIVEKSKPENSPTHGCFEWDDSKAGIEFRLIQARHWIRTISVYTTHSDGEPVNLKFAFVPSESGGDGEYKLPNVIVNNPTEFERCMDSALKDLSAAQERVEELRSCADKMGDENKTKILTALMFTLQSAGELLRKMQ